MSTVIISGAGNSPVTEAKATSVAIAGTGVAFLAAAYFSHAVFSTKLDAERKSGPALTAEEKEVLTKMGRISEVIRKSAQRYLNTQYKWLALWVCCLSIIIGAILRRSDNQVAGLYTMLSYIFGSILSGAAGYMGMYTATSANARTAKGCMDGGLAGGLQVSFASGAVMGNGVVGLALGGLWILYLIWTAVHPQSAYDPYYFDMVWGYIAGFGFGASSIGMFARVGGGVFTKAADVGADLVGKVEQGLPEDDPRNPAVIADNVGDNVGDVAGMGADLFESYAGALIACATLSPELYHLGHAGGWSGMTQREVMMAGTALPFWVYGLGIFCSIAGVQYVRAAPGLNANSTLSDLLHTVNKGIGLATVLSIVTTITACVILFDSPLSWRLFGSVIIGLVAGVIISLATEYYTSYEDVPTRNISAASVYGPAPVIIKGLGEGMMSCAIPTIVIVTTILACNALAGLYGVSIAAVGMLCTLGITLATDAYGPVADNAGGIAEMAGLGDDVRSLTDRLDSMGNTTAATGKGLAIGSALLTAVGLIAAFLLQSGMGSAGRQVDIKDPIVLSGILIGCGLPFIFGSLTMLSVDRGARAIITEVRLQFATAPALLEENAPESVTVDGQVYPNPERCVGIATEAAIQEMVLPGMLAVFVPVGTGFLLGPKGLGGLLAGALGTCFMLALTMANAGGAWDNSKKWNEKCAAEGEPVGTAADGSEILNFSTFGIKMKVAGELPTAGEMRTFEDKFLTKIAKGNWAMFCKEGEAVPATAEEKAAKVKQLSEQYNTITHAATVVGDTVGDPFKDTSGPALNVLSKTMTMVSLMLAPAYKGLGEQEGFDGFRPYGVIIAAVMLVVIGTLCIVSTHFFRQWAAEGEVKSQEAMKVARARTAAAKAAGGAAAAAAAPVEAAKPEAVAVAVPAEDAASGTGAQ